MRDLLGSSLGRMLHVFDLFTAEEPMLTAEQIVARLEYTRPTGYRYIRSLCAAGLLSRVAGYYSLGPRIIELDYVIRSADPTLKTSLPIIRGICTAAGCDVLVASLFGDRIIATHHERGPDPTPVSFSRGRPMPLFRGAGSKAILAFLPAARQRELFERYPEAVTAGVLPGNWDGFRAELRAIRRAGLARSLGELDPDNVALAAPILHEAPSAPGSLIMLLPQRRYAIADKALLERLLLGAAEQITSLLSESGIKNGTAVVPVPLSAV